MRRRDFLVAGSTGVAAAAAGARSQPQDPSSQVGVLAPERLAGRGLGPRVRAP